MTQMKYYIVPWKLKWLTVAGDEDIKMPAFTYIYSDS
jgi:hypothetical protein